MPADAIGYGQQEAFARLNSPLLIPLALTWLVACGEPAPAIVAGTGDVAATDDAPVGIAGDATAEDAAAPAQLLLPTGAGGPAFLAYPNHCVIRKYNNSVAYALAVGLLAERLAGAPPLTRAWPTEIPLSLADRIAAQESLAKLGVDPGSADGVIGSNTRAAKKSSSS